MKKITVVVGSRANLSSALPIMNQIKKSDECELSVVCFESAVSEQYGNISNSIEEMGFEVTNRIYSLSDGDPLAKMVMSTSNALNGFAGFFTNHEVDYVIVVGDRYEMMAPVIAAAYMNIKIVHTMGGEITGTIDESIRHSISKLSHIHCVATDKSRKRLIQLGENPKLVFNTGCPRIDFVKAILQQDINVQKTITNDGVGCHINTDKEFLLLSFHPVTTEVDQIREDAKILFDAIEECNLPTIALWPNSDGGGEYIAKEIRTRRETGRLKNLRIFKNFSVEIYTTLMNNCSVLVGNSSSGIREAAFIGTPVVNIGTRQKKRESTANVIHTSINKIEIIEAIREQLEAKKYATSNLYGDGSASEKILEAITKAKVSIQKEFFEWNS